MLGGRYVVTLNLGWPNKRLGPYLLYFPLAPPVHFIWIALTLLLLFSLWFFLGLKHSEMNKSHYKAPSHVFSPLLEQPWKKFLFPMMWSGSKPRSWEHLQTFCGIKTAICQQKGGNEKFRKGVPGPYMIKILNKQNQQLKTLTLLFYLIYSFFQVFLTFLS